MDEMFPKGLATMYLGMGHVGPFFLLTIKGRRKLVPGITI